LAASDYPNRHRELEAVLDDERAPSRLRYLAAIGLARADREGALEILIRASDTPDQRVLGGVLRALGQIGDETALDAVERAIGRSRDRARAQGEFARTLIVHRLGLTNRRTPVLTPSDVLSLAEDCGQPVLVRPARGAVARQSLAALGARPYGIELTGEAVFEFVCGRCRGAILLNREHTGADALSTLRQRPAIFGLGALADDLAGSWSVAAVMLTAPEERGDRIRIAIHLTNGERVFDGLAEVHGDDARWGLRAVRRLGAFPIRAEGSFSSGRLRITVAESRQRVVRSERPRLIESAGPRREVKLRAPAEEA
jgi:hypothetical protein